MLFRTLARSLLCIASARALELLWPNAPEAGAQYSIRWNSGTAPFTVYVLTADLTKYYYKYTGSDLITYWTFNLNAGTRIAFQVIDATGLKVTSTPVTVIAGPEILYPTSPQSGVSSSIRWSGGTAPYTVYVLTTDLTKYYYKYQGSALITYWDFSIAAGTQVRFQCVDSVGVKSTGNTVTVQANAGLISQSQQSVLSINSVNSVRSVDAGISVASVASVASISEASVQQNSLEVQSLSIISVASVASVNSINSAQSQTITSPPPGATSTTATSATGTNTNANGINSGSIASRTTSSSASASSSGAPGGGASHKSSSNTGSIAGGVVGGVLGLALIAGIGWFLYHKQAAAAHAHDPPAHDEEGGAVEEAKPDAGQNPFYSPGEAAAGGAAYGGAQQQGAPYAQPNYGGYSGAPQVYGPSGADQPVAAQTGYGYGASAGGGGGGGAGYAPAGYGAAAGAGAGAGAIAAHDSPTSPSTGGYGHSSNSSGDSPYGGLAHTITRSAPPPVPAPPGPDIRPPGGSPGGSYPPYGSASGHDTSGSMTQPSFGPYNTSSPPSSPFASDRGTSPHYSQPSFPSPPVSPAPQYSSQVGGGAAGFGLGLAGRRRSQDSGGENKGPSSPASPIPSMYKSFGGWGDGPETQGRG